MQNFTLLGRNASQNITPLFARRFAAANAQCHGFTLQTFVLDTREALGYLESLGGLSASSV